MKKLYIVALVVIIIILGFMAFYSKQVIAPVNTIQTANEVASVEKYVRDNIKMIAPDKPVLGGSWYVVSVDLNTSAKNGTVVYEDGHIQSTATFSYNFNAVTNAVNIQNFVLKNPNPVSQNGKVEGRVTLSPICPVERMPPDPGCAPKGYATSIFITKNGTAVKTIQSDANGAFQTTLPPGAYILKAGSGTRLPMCNDTAVQVKSNQVSTADISCDTGIR